MENREGHIYETLLITICFLVTVALLAYRADKIDGLLIYMHSYGESQYAAFARAYLEEGFFWGFRAVDRYYYIANYFPLSSLLTAWLYGFTGGDLIVVGRSLSLAVSVAACLFYYRYALLIFESRLTAAVSLVIFTCLPINMYYSKTFYNDPLHFCLLIMFFYYLHRYFTGSAGKSLSVLLALIFGLILITKISSLTMILPVVLYFAAREYRTKGRLPIGRLLPLVAPLLLVVSILAFSRLSHPDEIFAESTKLINADVVRKPLFYLGAVARLYLEEFGRILVLFVLGAILALTRRDQSLYFVLMSAGFAFFFIVMIRGAIIHQYYSLPFVLPFSILATNGLCFITSLVTDRRGAQLLLTGLVTALILSDAKPGRAFRPVFSHGAVEVADFMKSRVDRESTLVLGKTCRIMQYYLEVPERNIKCERSDFVDNVVIGEYAKEHLIKYVVTEDDNAGVNEEIRQAGFVPLFTSTPSVRGDHFVVFGRK